MKIKELLNELNIKIELKEKSPHKANKSLNGWT